MPKFFIVEFKKIEPTISAFDELAIAYKSTLLAI